MAKIIKQLLICGEDYLLERHLKRVLSQIVDSATRDFNFEKYSAKDVSISQSLEKIKTFPMMADSRVVVIENFDHYKAEDLEKMLPVLKEDLPTHMIFIASKTDKRTKFYKTFSQCGEVIEFKKPYRNQLADFLRQEAKVLKVDLEVGVAELMVELVGTDLMSLIQELEKLSLYALPEKKVTKKDVQELVAQGLVDNIFELGNLIGQKKLSEASQLFERMIEQGEPVIKIVSLIIGHFRKILLTKENSTSRSPQPLAQLLKVPAFFTKDYEKQARLFPLPELRKVYRTLMQLSEELRFSRIDRNLLFLNFIQHVGVHGMRP